MNADRNIGRLLDENNAVADIRSHLLRNSNLNLTRDSINEAFRFNDDSKLPLTYSLSLPKCRSTTDVHQHHHYQQQRRHLVALPPPPPPSSATMHHYQMSSRSGNDYRPPPSCQQHQQNSNASNNRLPINQHHMKPATSPVGYPASNNSYRMFEMYSSLDRSSNQACVCNDSAVQYPNRFFDRRNLTLSRRAPPSAAATTTVSFNDPYLRQYANKLNKLQTFISTPDLTSENVNTDANHTQNMTDQILTTLPPPPPPPPSTLAALTSAAANVTDLMRPDVIQMHTFRSNDKAQPMDPASTAAQIFQCFHHHKHNQPNQKSALSSMAAKQSGQTGIGECNQTPISTTSFFGDNCCAVSCKKVTIVTRNNDDDDGERNSLAEASSTPATVTSTRF